MNRSSFDRWTKDRASRPSRRSFLRGAAGAGVALIGASTPSAIAKPGKVTLCHHTGNRQHPYRIVTVSSRAAEAHLGHGDFEAIWCDNGWSCEPCPPCVLVPLFCKSAEVCPTRATEFCPGGPFDPTSSDQAKAACEACFGPGACVHDDLDCSGAGWLLNFSPESEPPIGAPVFGYESGMCDSPNPQPPGRVYFGTASDPTTDYGMWGSATCPA